MKYNNMLEQRVYKLKIDSAFKQLISPLSEKELKQLEQNIIRDGCREPLCVWHNTILDGHNRYEICTRRQIPFMIQPINLKNREEAIVWICANQLGRRNITEETRRYLIGKRYETEKILGAHNAAGINQHTKKEVRAKMLPEPPFGITASRTRERLAEEYSISHASVLKYEQYSRALDLLSGVVPELVQKVLSGEIKIGKEKIIDMSRLSIQDTKSFEQLVVNNPAQFIRHINIPSFFPKRPGLETGSSLPIPAGSVKDTPPYDPDAEISSLALTVPSWASSINRVRAAADFGIITDYARHKLEKELVELKVTIDSMLEAMKEVK